MPVLLSYCGGGVCGNPCRNSNMLIEQYVGDGVEREMWG